MKVISQLNYEGVLLHCAEAKYDPEYPDKVCLPGGCIELVPDSLELVGNNVNELRASLAQWNEENSFKWIWNQEAQDFHPYEYVLPEPEPEPRNVSNELLDYILFREAKAKSSSIIKGIATATDSTQEEVKSILLSDGVLQDITLTLIERYIDLRMRYYLEQQDNNFPGTE